MGRRVRNPAVSLFPYERMDVLSIQEVQQQVGWNITAFDLPDAWLKTQGEGVKVAVLDTGVDLDHPDLINNLLPGLNVLDPTKSVEDDCGHGTHAAGIICAENNTIGMVGVAPKSKVIPIKCLDKHGNGNMKNVMAGMRAAIDLGADIISMSLGTPSPLPEIQKLIQEAAAKGIPCFVAAGNAGNTKDVFYPSAYPEAIAVGAIDDKFERAKFSNTGRNLDFLAPGVDILSTVPDNWYSIMTGTSMASPWVVGIAALLLSACRSHYGADCPLKTVEDFRNKFREHTTHIKGENAGKHFFEGYGIISVKDFIAEF
jgi:subtilisin family serine protease